MTSTTGTSGTTGGTGDGATMVDVEELTGVLRDVCRMCEGRAARLESDGATVAIWPAFEERGLVEMAATAFQTLGGADAWLRVYGIPDRELTQVQTLVLRAYASHARASLL